MEKIWRKMGGKSEGGKMLVFPDKRSNGALEGRVENTGRRKMQKIEGTYKDIN